MSMPNNRRKYFRLLLEPSLCSEMTIVRIKENVIEASSCMVCIEDIGPGGLRFTTPLKLIVTPHVVLEFRMRILNETVKLHGYIVRQTELPNALYQYGVQFTIDEAERAAVQQMLNELAIRLRRGGNLFSCDFCATGKESCFACLSDRHQGKEKD